MLIALVFRAHRLATKARAYRRDYCCTCEGEQLSIQWRSFVLLHLYFIPLIPLGFWREWRCKRCGQDPAFRENTWARILRLGGVLFGAIAIWVTVGMCSEALDRGHLPFPGMSVLILLGWWSVASLLIVTARRSLRTPDREEALRELKPADLERCEVCNATLASPSTGGSTLVCSGCGLERLTG